MAEEELVPRTFIPVGKDDELLHRKVAPGKPGSESYRLIEEMALWMRNYEPALIGIAANQLGIDEALCVVQNPANAASLTFLLNPTIKFYQDIEIEGVEACLSLPGEIYAVKRHYRAVIEYQSVLDGNDCVWGPVAHWARVAQHEIDHLNGVLISDKGRLISPKEEERMTQVHIRREIVNFESLCGDRQGFAYGYTPVLSKDWGFNYKRCERCVGVYREKIKGLSRLLEVLGPTS